MNSPHAVNGFSMPTEIILIRHGETDWNAERRIQGHLQIPLNANGRRQAAAVVAALAGENIDALYSSDLERCLQTVAPLAARRGLEVAPLTELREWDLGVLAGMTAEEAALVEPDALRIYRERTPNRVIPGGESIQQRFERVTSCLARLATNHPGERICVITHGGPTGDCYRYASNLRLGVRLGVDLCNAAINRISIEGPQWKILDWGRVDHLANIGTLKNWEGRNAEFAPSAPSQTYL